MEGTNNGLARGRGGRGALLLAALNNQPRRPGESLGAPVASLGPPPAISTGVQPELTPPPISVGRGALLQKLLQDRNSAAASNVETKPPSIGRGACVIPASFGRGKPSAIAPIIPSVSNVGNEEKRPVEDIPVSEVITETEPPVEEMQSMKIGEHSGSSGRTVPMQVNYVRLRNTQSYGICEYHIDFNPSVDSRNMRFKLLSQPEVRERIGNVKNFDGSKLYLPKKISDVTLVGTMPTDNSSVNIHIKYIKQACSRDMIHFYNSLFHKIMRVLKLVQMNRDHYDPKCGIPVPQHRLEIWPGYITAVQDFEGGIMLNCDASFKVLRTVSARDIICQCASNADRMQLEVNKNLVGSVVITRYNNKTYKVDDVSYDTNPLSKFVLRDGKEITFVDYFKNSYDITVTDMTQPMLINRPKRNPNETSDSMIFLVPELCFMTGLTDAMRNDFKVMKDISCHTRLSPGNRQRSLDGFVKKVKSTPEAMKVLSDWNLEFDSATLSLQGRSLDFEQINFKNSSCSAGPKADWSRNAVNSKVLVPVAMENWILIFTNRDSPKAMDFLKMVHTVASHMDIRVGDPLIRKINNDRTETFSSELRDHVNPRVQLVVIIFPSSRDDRYHAIKKLCCIEMPVPSQVINARTISQFNKLRSVTQKIVLQINCKLGGELWSLSIPMKNIMVCGMDAYHDSTNKKNSVLAFVASLNCNLTRWFSMTNTQRSGQEIGDCLKLLFMSALKKYHQVNHMLPQKIFIFRDGVGDGMIKTVVEYEVPQLTSCFVNVQQGYAPSLSMIVVQKRINTRIFAESRDGLSNPQPGSIVDHTITRKGMYDFFLVSQHVGQGTVSPTHYIVGHDSSTLKADHMQKLTYKLTHLYYNWPGTIRVPAPCMYAHKLAFLVGQSLHKEAHVDLADKLFYL